MMKLHWIFQRYMAPADDEGSTGGSAPDRGDDFTPTDDDAEDHVKKAEGKVESEAKKEETEEKAEPETKKEEKAEPETKPKDTRLPLSRHQEILDKERQRRADVEAELAKYKQGEAIKATNADITAAEDKLVKMEVEYQKLIADGELKEAADKMREIRQAERSINDARTGLMVQAAEARAVEQVRYDTTVDRIEAAYPTLNPDHEEYDKAKVVEIMELKTAYQTMGHPPAAALQKAVKQLMPAATTKQETAVETEARVDKEDVAAQLKKDRKATAVSKAADAIDKTPPSTTKVGLDSDKTGGPLSAKDVMKMSQEDFKKLDEATLAKMRGDELV